MSPDLLLLVAAMTSGVVTAALMNLKWVRVAQRVHYLPREVARLERLWFDRQPLGALWWGGAAILALTSVQGSAWLNMPELAWLAVIAPLMILPTPWRLPFRGVTSPLAWTPRAQRAYAGIFVLQLVLGTLTVVVLGPAGVLIPLLFTANLADLALGFSLVSRAQSHDEVCLSGSAQAQESKAPRGGDYGKLWQDLHQGLCRHTGGRNSFHCCFTGKL